MKTETSQSSLRPMAEREISGRQTMKKKIRNERLISRNEKSRTDQMREREREFADMAFGLNNGIKYTYNILK